jgi:hypothetical protein
MHKVRLSQNNYQLVAENGGQSSEVLMSNYNEALESEKRTLSMLVETSFYPSNNKENLLNTDEKMELMESLDNNPGLVRQLMQLLQSGAAIV